MFSLTIQILMWMTIDIVFFQQQIWCTVVIIIFNKIAFVPRLQLFKFRKSETIT